MNRIIGVGGVCALVAAVGAVFAPAAHAQTPLMVTFTFKLTINGTAAKGDGFAVTWGETGLNMCNAPCLGAGHTYVQSMVFPRGVTETFVFTRAFHTTGTNISLQKFGTQTLTANEDRTVSAFFDYGSSAAVATPSTGSMPSVLLGAVVTGSGLLLPGSGYIVVDARAGRPAGPDRSIALG